MALRKTISWILFPLTMWYAVVVGVRNMLFNLGILKQQTPPIATIGVGNIACGGTGKTPHVEYLLRLLQEDYRTALLSRGYRRKSKGFVMDDRSWDPCERTRQLGDEPAMVAGKFPNTTVAVCEKRADGLLRLAQEEVPPEVVVLDDAYQHRFVRPSLNILLTEYRKPYYKDWVLPFGDLRESRMARHRAEIIVVTKTPPKFNPIEKRDMLAMLKTERRQKVFFSYLRYGEPQPLNGSEPLTPGSLRHALVVTGIAHPEPMVQYLKTRCKVTLMAFGDHHEFSDTDLAKIRKTFEALPKDRRAIVTTEKDATRLMAPHCREPLQGIPIYTLPIEVAFHEDKAESFDEAVLGRIKEARRWTASRTETTR